MNLNKMFVFIFVFFIVFAVFLATMPAEFLLLGIDADVQDKDAASFFDSQNVTMYNYTYSINPLEYGISNKSSFGLPEPQKLEFWWNTVPRWGTVAFQLRHLVAEFLGWWYDWHHLTIQEPYKSMIKYPDYPDLGLVREDVVTNLWDEQANASYCEFACSHIKLKVFIATSNQSWTLAESWDNGDLLVYTSYDIDWGATGTSMWGVMMQLLTFQNPDLGIPGIGGQILSVGFGGALWASIAILAFALITSVIPTISGWRGD